MEFVSPSSVHWKQAAVPFDMSAFDEREDPFASLGSEYKQSKFYRDVFGLVVSYVLDKE